MSEDVKDIERNLIYDDYLKKTYMKTIIANYDNGVRSCQSELTRLREENEALKKDKSILRCGECGSTGMWNTGIQYIANETDSLRTECNDVKTKLALAVEALEFYADGSNHMVANRIIDDGKRARQTLKEIEPT